MKSLFKVALCASAVAGAAFAIPTAASARSSVGIYLNTGSVAFAYRDGWWDKDHHFHHWKNRAEMRWYEKHHHDAYHDWNHDRDSDNGWHDRGDMHHDDHHDGAPHD